MLGPQDDGKSYLEFEGMRHYKILELILSLMPNHLRHLIKFGRKDKIVSRHNNSLRFFAFIDGITMRRRVGTTLAISKRWTKKFLNSSIKLFFFIGKK